MKSDSSKELKNAILGLLRDNNLRKQMGKYAIKKVNKNFSARKSNFLIKLFAKDNSL